MITKMSLLSFHIVLTSGGQLDAAVHVMVHVVQRYNSILVYDLLYSKIDHSVFKKCDWSEFYRDVKEAKPMNVPEHLVKEVDIHMFVDGDYAGDKVSC